MHTRREFITRSALISAGAVIGTRGFAQEPAFPGMITRMSEPENLEFPFASLSKSIIPNEQFFIRSHFAVPKIDFGTWKLTVDGEVKQKLELTLDDLKKLPQREMPATIECAGNGRVHLTPAVPGLQWGQGAVGNAVWAGVPLAAILEKAGLRDAALEVILEGADVGQINSDPKSPGPIAFARSIPIDKARHESTLLATTMNGSALPVSHGAPLRAVVGGWYGMSSVKWLSRITVTQKPYGGFWQTLDYSYWERWNGYPQLLPITVMEVKSSIARPGLHDVIPAGKPYRIFGAAWAGESAVAKVEVSTDGGQTWNTAKLLDKPQPLVWSLWEYTWNVPAATGPVKLLVRATDTNGRGQPTERSVDRRSYMVNHLVPVVVTVK